MFSSPQTSVRCSHQKSNLRNGIKRWECSLINNWFSVCVTLLWRSSPYHIETRQLICFANQWTGFYMTSTYVIKELTICPKHFHFHYKTISKKKKYLNIDTAILPVWLTEATFLATFLHILSDIEKSK